MTSPPPQAVFLSYASQDAESARRICEALRGEGLEAWFDQSELRGGDAWDQKIRRQIKECALFMPLISANTNARVEGYFRLEWKLAVDRSHLMADDAPFLFPVAIDGSKEAEARVPDRFRDVQWMRLESETPEAIAKRAVKFLAHDIAPVPRRREPAPSRKSFHRYVWPFVGIAFALFFITKPLWQPKRDGGRSPAAAASPAPASEAAELSRRAIDATTKLAFSRADLAVAADLARKATELDPTLAVAWGARARVESAWIFRNWDQSEGRRRVAQDHAKRALALDPEEPNGLFTLGTVLSYQRALPEAEALFLRALKNSPEDNYIRRALAWNYLLQGRPEEAVTILQEALRRDPRDPLTHMSAAWPYANFFTVKDNDPANVDKALAHLDRSLEAHVSGTALVAKASLQAAWKGDFEGARATLARIAALPHEEATEDRAIFFKMWIALLDRQPEKALAASALTTSTYFADATVAAPIAWLKALAHHQARRESAAIEEWHAAEALLRSRLAASPDSLPTQAELAITLAMLGRKDEAAKQFARYDAAMRDRGPPGTSLHILYYAAMGDAKRFAASVKEARKVSPIWVTDVVLARDPWFDSVRGQPEFRALTAASR